VASYAFAAWRIRCETLHTQSQAQERAQATEAQELAAQEERELEENGGNQHDSGAAAAITITQDAAPHGLVLENAPGGGQITLLATPASFSFSQLQLGEGFGGVFPRRVVSDPPVSLQPLHVSPTLPALPLGVEREADGGNPVAI
jgi:hypothetical protein